MPKPLPILPSPCGRCHAACCRQNGHAFAVLLRPDEYRRFAPYSVSRPFVDAAGRTSVERVLPYTEAGLCQFLDGATNLCTIYDDRPQSCRDFECTRYYHQHGPGRHGQFLELNPAVRALLDEDIGRTAAAGTAEQREREEPPMGTDERG